MRSIQELVDERTRLAGLAWDLDNLYLNNPERYAHGKGWDSLLRRSKSLTDRGENLSRLIIKAQGMPSKMAEYNESIKTQLEGNL